MIYQLLEDPPKELQALTNEVEAALKDALREVAQ
jgi:hypothetical protein